MQRGNGNDKWNNEDSYYRLALHYGTSQFMINAPDAAQRMLHA